MDISNANLIVKALDGVASVGPFSGTVNEGHADLNIVIDTRPNRSIVTVNLVLNEFNLSRSMIFKGTELIEHTGGSWINLALRDS